MLALALGVLAASPGSFLSETPVARRHARFIESPVEFTGAMAVGQAMPYAQMTDLAQLQGARAEEESRRTSVGGFVVMAVVGGLAAFVAAPILVWAALFTTGLSGGTTVLTPLVIAAITTFVVGAVIFGVGLGLLIAAILRNAKIGHNVRLIDRRMKELQKQQNAPPGYQQPYAPQPYMPAPQTPSAPPPPPQGFLNVEPTLELASF